MRSLLKQLRRRLNPDRRPFVLGYHRVIDLRIDPWGMAISPRTFEEQVKRIARYARTDLSAFDPAESGFRVFVTFDDGYRDNLENALPILKRHGVPATLFLATGCVGCGREFWWDQLERVFLFPGSLPETLDLEVDGERVVAPLGRDRIYSDADFDQWRHWKAWSPAPTMRHQLYQLLWSILYRASVGHRERLMEALNAWASVDAAARPEYGAVTADEVREMGRDGFSFGCHTVNHISLTRHPRDCLEDEIRRSRETVEEITGKNATLFSYPHGDTGDSDIVEHLRNAGIRYGFSSKPGRIRNQTDPMIIPRNFVGEEDVRKLEKMLP